MRAFEALGSRGASTTIHRYHGEHVTGLVRGIAVPKLLIDESGNQSVYEIFDTEVTIGRGASNGVQLHDSAASKFHAAVRNIQGHWKLIDLESRNGVAINGQRRNQHWLHDGDTLSIGTSTLRYAAEGAREGPPVLALEGIDDEIEEVIEDVDAALPQMLDEEVIESLPMSSASTVSPRTPAPSTPSRGAPARRAPSRAAPVVSSRRSRTRDDYDDDDYEEDRRSRYGRDKKRPSWVVPAIVLGAAAFIPLMFMMAGGGMNHNQKVLSKGEKLVDQNKIEDAIRYAEVNGQEGGESYSRLEASVMEWKSTIQARKDVKRNEEARKYFDYEIFRKSVTPKVSPKNALPNAQVVERLRDYMKKYWDTLSVQNLLHNEQVEFKHYRDLLRENADGSLKAGAVYAEIGGDLDQWISSGDYGRAALRLTRHKEIYRLIMTDDTWKDLKSLVDTRMQSLEMEANSAFVREREALDAIIASKDKHKARSRIKTLLRRFALGDIPSQLRALREGL